jgi:AraC family transcriptional regulator
MKASTERDHRGRIDRTRAWLEAHLDEPFAIEDLAHEAALSLHHFHRVFRGVVGESVSDHLRRLRLERAARRLRTTDRGILEIAMEAGYGSHEAFTRAFAAHFAVTPSTYREDPGARIEAFLARSPGTVPAVTLSERREVLVASMRHVGGWSGVGALFDALFAWAARTGRARPGMEVCGLCSDDPDITPEEKLRMDACVVVPDGTKPDGEVFMQTIRAGLYAGTIHVGPYTTLGETYLALIGHWLPTTSYVPSPDPVLERYLDGPEVPEERRRTEVAIRLETR